MDPLTLPVVNEKGVVQIINISITLEAADAEAAKEIEKIRPAPERCLYSRHVRCFGS